MVTECLLSSSSTPSPVNVQTCGTRLSVMLLASSSWSEPSVILVMLHFIHNLPTSQLSNLKKENTDFSV